MNIQGSGHSRVDLSLYNLQGQLVFQKYQLSLGKLVKLDLHDLPAGIYMLSTLRSGYQNVYKLVKQ
ncbi:T9SS type A sorting domain-containing protein [Thermaurantimonas sp.]|uniref:T9SS type A sorting domain-containing protein n=1 Tax=Thermaurantimonas sp. TaxID=2681568 RepID=UPI00391C1F69